MNKEYQKKWKKAYDSGSMICVKVFYKDGKHRYANLFSVKNYELGLKLGSIKGYRHMNFIEKMLFKNCL